MSLYTLALFAHILGVLGLFVVVSFQWVILTRVRKVQTVEQVGEWTGLAHKLERIEQVSGLLILGAGIYMVTFLQAWQTPWVLVSLLVFLIIAVLAAVISLKRLKAIHAASIKSMDTSLESLRSRINDPVLWTTVNIIVFVIPGITFLMTNKPDLAGSLLTIVVAIILGVIFAQLWRPKMET